MSNMSYCRFQNTLQDLKDCRDVLIDLVNYGDSELDEEDDDLLLSKEEDRAKDRLIEICREIVELYDHQ